MNIKKDNKINKKKKKRTTKLLYKIQKECLIWKNLFFVFFFLFQGWFFILPNHFPFFIVFYILNYFIAFFSFSLKRKSSNSKMSFGCIGYYLWYFKEEKKNCFFLKREINIIVLIKTDFPQKEKFFKK